MVIGYQTIRMGMNKHAKRKLLFVVTEDWYFCSHRLPIALAAMAGGMEVALATNVGAHADLLRKAGIAVYPWYIRRGSTRLWDEARSVLSLLSIYRRFKPDIAHHVAIKPVLYGSLIARLTGAASVVNALGGMGAIFTNSTDNHRTRRKLIMTGFRWLLGGKRNLLILQNPDDRALLVAGAALDDSIIRLIRGGGVNLVDFDVSPEPPGVPLVVLPARMLADKGVVEFVEAARQLKSEGVQARFALVGGTDPCNPAAILEDQLSAWVDEGAVEWFGRRDDMPAVYAAAAIACLPSYREGLPKALLEAAASGRPIVATDVPGCREIVRHECNGLLVPARDAAALADALRTLLAEPALRARLGSRGREMAVNEFSEERVVSETLAIYRSFEGSGSL